MKTKKRSRFIVIFLSFLICMSLMPTTALAAPGDVEISEETFPMRILESMYQRNVIQIVMDPCHRTNFIRLAVL